MVFTFVFCPIFVTHSFSVTGELVREEDLVAFKVVTDSAVSFRSSRNFCKPIKVYGYLMESHLTKKRYMVFQFYFVFKDEN